MYLGLVLAGATPQILAQAAMTRQFDVKDEIEVTDNLDKKPDTTADGPSETAVSETDGRITRSVERFLAKFKPVGPLDSLCDVTTPSFEKAEIQRIFAKNSLNNNIPAHRPLEKLVVVTNLARAGLDPLFA